jgi:hypothetical protein
MGVLSNLVTILENCTIARRIDRYVIGLLMVAMHSLLGGIERRGSERTQVGKRMLEATIMSIRIELSAGPADGASLPRARTDV